MLARADPRPKSPPQSKLTTTDFDTIPIATPPNHLRCADESPSVDVTRDQQIGQRNPHAWMDSRRREALLAVRTHLQQHASLAPRIDRPARLASVLDQKHVHLVTILR